MLIISRFQYHCKPQISRILRTKEIKTLNEAITFALNEEKIESMYRNEKPNKLKILINIVKLVKIIFITRMNVEKITIKIQNPLILRSLTVFKYRRKR